MNIETLQPQPALQKYIEFYYFIRNQAADFKSIHYSFPHTINVLSIYKQANYHSVVGHVEIYNDPKSNYLTILQGKCQMPLKVELTGKTDRISIFFKTFGLNQFIQTSLASVMSNKPNQLTEWDTDPMYKNYLDQCFATDNQEEKIRHLEDFLLWKLKPSPPSPFEKAVTLLSDFEHNHTIEEILSQLKMPLRTFNRRFKEVIGISAIEYRNIARFRHSLNNKLFNSKFKKLTEIGYNSNFYDQSYFIKMYKKLTGSNPSAFFKTVEKLGDDKLIFQFVKK